jgi:hypothetical protein
MWYCHTKTIIISIIKKLFRLRSCELCRHVVLEMVNNTSEDLNAFILWIKLYNEDRGGKFL